MEFAIQSLINSWVEQHSLIAWLLQHPLISLISFLIVLILLFRLFNAIAQLLDKLWIWLLKSPILLFKSLFGFKNKPTGTSIVQTQELSTINSRQISQIMEKLEIIKQQQQQIIQEIATLKIKN
jgi:uncharacterized membrane protein